MMKSTQKLLLLLGVCFGVSSAHSTVHFEPREDRSSILFYAKTPPVESYPLLLVIQGAKCKSVSPHLDKWPLLESRGVGLLVVEKYGISKDIINCPEEYFRNNDVSQRIDDYLRVLSAARTLFPSWDGRLFLMGGSEGAHVAARLASVVFPQKVALISGGLGMTVADALPLAAEKKLRKEGASDALIQTELGKFAVKYNQILSNPTWEKFWGLTTTYKYWNSILFHHAWEDLTTFGGPILDIHGSEDTVSPVEASRKLGEFFRERQMSNLTRWELEGYNHDMVDPEGKDRMVDVIGKAVDWLLE